MYGSQIGSLRVYSEVGNEDNGEVVMSSSDNLGVEWNMAYIPLTYDLMGSSVKVGVDILHC